MSEEFGRYRLDELIGRGGMGEVWKAYDREHRRTVAIKRITPTDAHDRQFRERFRRESRLAVGLSHPNIIPIFDFGEIDDRMYIAMQWVEATDLGKCLRGGALAPTEAVAVVEQAARALDAAHASQLVHRDVKPSNLLLTSDGHVYLIDFGISRPATVGDTTSSNGARRPTGTAGYIAPERYRGVRSDGRGDVFSLTCVLYQALTGQQAFTDHVVDSMGVLATFTRASRVRPELPEVFNSVLARGLAADPDSRYATAGELAGAARAAQQKAEAVRPDGGERRGGDGRAQPADDSAQPRRPAQKATPLPRTKVRPHPVRPPWRDRVDWRQVARRAVVTTAVLGAIAGGTAWWLAPRPDPPPDPRIRIAGSPLAAAVVTERQEALVVATGEDTVYVVDLAARAVDGTVAVGDEPYDVAVSPDGEHAYTANSGDDTVSVLDLTDGTAIVTATITVESDPQAVVLSPLGDRLYVSNRGSASVSVIDTASRRVIGTIGVGSWLIGDSARGLALSPNGSRLLVAMPRYWYDDSVAVADTRSLEVLTRIPVGEGPVAVTFGATDDRAYVANGRGRSVSVVDVVNSAVTTTVDIGTEPSAVTLTPDGDRVVVASRSADTLTAVDVGSNEIRSTTPVGGPADVVAVPGTGRMLVVQTDYGTITQLDGF